jgi:hypothetical protein
VEDSVGLVTILDLYLLPRHTVQQKHFEDVYNALTWRFIEGGDYYAKYADWGSRLISFKGRELLKTMESKNLNRLSTGEPTYWPSDRNKLPDLRDFCVTKGIHQDFAVAKSCRNLSSDLDHKAMLKQIWTYGIQMWAMASTSHIEVLECLQTKVLCIIVDAPWYVLNMVIWRDLHTPTVKEEISHYNSQYSASLSGHPSYLVVTSWHNPTTGDCKDTCQTICLPDSKLSRLICNFVFKV